MQANSKVELCAFDGKTWIRIAATAVRDENKKAKEHMLDVYPNLKAMYSAEDDNRALSERCNSNLFLFYRSLKRSEILIGSWR